MFRSRGASVAAYARRQPVRLTSLPNRCRPIFPGGRSRLVAFWRALPTQITDHCGVCGYLFPGGSVVLTGGQVNPVQELVASMALLQ
jgi:hypothetical protein